MTSLQDSVLIEFLEFVKTESDITKLHPSLDIIEEWSKKIDDINSLLISNHLVFPLLEWTCSQLFLLLSSIEKEDQNNLLVNRKEEEEEQLKYCQFLEVFLRKCFALLQKQQNLKKLYQTFVQSHLDTCLKILHLIHTQVSSNDKPLLKSTAITNKDTKHRNQKRSELFKKDCSFIAEDLENILGLCVFHRDHLMELVPLLYQLKDGEFNLTGFKTYVKAILTYFSEKISKQHVCSADNTKCDSAQHIFNEFSSVFNILDESLGHRLKNISMIQIQHAKLKFIKYLFHLIEMKGSSLQELDLVGLQSLLSCLLHSGLYVSYQEKEWFQSKVYSNLRLYHEKFPLMYLECLIVVVQLDFSIIFPDEENLLAFLSNMVCSYKNISTHTNEEEEKVTIVNVVSILLEFHTKSRTLESFLKKLFSHKALILFLEHETQFYQCWEQKCIKEYSFSQLVFIWNFFIEQVESQVLSSTEPKSCLVYSLLETVIMKLNPMNDLQKKWLDSAVVKLHESVIDANSKNIISTSIDISVRVIHLSLALAKYIPGYYSIFTVYVENKLINNLSKNKAIFDAQMRTILFHIAHLASYSSSQDTLDKCRSLLKILEQHAWSPNNVSDSVILSLFEYLPVLSRLGSIDLIQKTMEHLFLLFASQHLVGDTEKRDLVTPVATVLRNAEFYESVSSRSILFQQFKIGIYNVFKFDKKSEVSSQLQNALASMADLKPLQDSELEKQINLVIRLSEKTTLKELGQVAVDGFKLENIFSLMHVLPTEYFNVRDREFFFCVLILIDRILCFQLLSGQNKPNHSKLMVICRIILWKLIQVKPSKNILTEHPKLLMSMFDLITNAASKSIIPENSKILKSTRCIFKSTFSQLCEVYSDKNKSNNSSLSPINIIMTHLSSQTSSKGNVDQDFSFTGLLIHDALKAINGRLTDWIKRKLFVKDFIDFKIAIQKKTQNIIDALIESNISDSELEAIAENGENLFISMTKQVMNSVDLVMAGVKALGKVCRRIDSTLNNKVYFDVFLNLVHFVFETLNDFGDVDTDNMVSLLRQVMFCIQLQCHRSYFHVKMDSILSILKILIQKMNKDQHKIAFDLISNQVSIISTTRNFNSQVQSNSWMILSIQMLRMILSEINYKVGRTEMKKNIQNIILTLNSKLQHTNSFVICNQIIMTFQSICMDDFYDVSTIDIGFVFSGILSLSTKTHPLMMASCGDSNAAKDTFKNLCRLLLVIVRQRKHKLLDIIHLFLNVVRGLLQSFRRISKRSAAREKKRKSHLLSTEQQLIQQTHKILNEQGENILETPNVPFPVFAIHGPLDDTCVEAFTRVLQSISQKQYQQTQSDDIDLHNRSSNTLTTTTRPFAKYMVYILADYAFFQCSTNPISPNIKEKLMEGLYEIMDILGEHEREILLHGVGTLKTDLPGYEGPLLGKDSARALVKNLVSDWQKCHKFKGKV